MYESSAPILQDARPSVSSFTPRESAIVVGTAVVDITPPVGIRAHNWGAARIGHATGVHRPLTASALALHDTAAGAWRYIVTADLGWWHSIAVYAGVFDPIAAALDATDQTLLLHLVHTHAGPSLAEGELGLPGSELVEPYRERLVEQIVEACRAAREAAAPQVVTWAYGHCDMAVNREFACGDREVLAFNPTRTADDTVAVGRVSDSSGAVTAVLVNYACHPTTLAHENSLLSPDFIGATRELVERVTGASCFFFQGASGDLSPREQYSPGTDLADRHGRSLGHAVLSTLETMSAPSTRLEFAGVVESGAPLGIWYAEPAEANSEQVFLSGSVELECRPVVSAAELAERWAGIDPLAAQERIARSQRLADGYRTGLTAEHPVWVWQLGDAVFVAQPGEAFSKLQLELRERFADRMIVVLNLTNGPGFMYLPPTQTYDVDSYQVWQTLLARGGLERVIAFASDLIETLPAPRPVLA
ncbi:neutral/alkaline non-lysosomal ceramidase N-terminal domain-containing protein [Subtercola endophyticus]|uniref:neutral/alkaline non-lysosomal ceramidase N-terminal domain-containing protein n=1 Tax=Subtercola endophyticus TaxID=2895559 RepID=UPI001E4ECA3B|nr:neutral/alkaline non-lysosomal ceramidase N-terminal domain-containing protein [Subtercola endophyticus]UFS58555.1 neutral/alkaline non-lysosomal ceramidase N-terminal domain-containing protein [Subtercola endophyticus]